MIGTQLPGRNCINNRIRWQNMLTIMSVNLLEGVDGEADGRVAEQLGVEKLGAALEDPADGVEEGWLNRGHVVPDGIVGFL